MGDYMEHTRFEKARIIGARALQITMGAPPLIRDRKGIISPVDLAESEYRKGVIPINALRDI
jgi:DNA-directed RNA polymerase subunit K